MKSKKNLEESIRAQLKNLSQKSNRPFDEILRYYAMERFLYRLSISPYVERFFLKGGLMLKVWDSRDHRATMDIDLLARTSNQIKNLQRILVEIADIGCNEDAIFFDTQRLIMRKTQAAGEYEGISASFLAKLHTTQLPVLIDIGFNDTIIPKPQKIQYPTLLNMSSPSLLGYTLETVVAEKLESIVKLALVNTRMKDFYDVWTLLKMREVNQERLHLAIKEVFSKRKTQLKYPIAFTPIFYASPKTERHWNNFLSLMGKPPINFAEVIADISDKVQMFMEKETHITPET